MYKKKLQYFLSTWQLAAEYIFQSVMISAALLYEKKWKWTEAAQALEELS